MVSFCKRQLQHSWNILLGNLDSCRHTHCSWLRWAGSRSYQVHGKHPTDWRVQWPGVNVIKLFFPFSLMLEWNQLICLLRAIFKASHVFVSMVREPTQVQYSYNVILYVSAIGFTCKYWTILKKTWWGLTLINGKKWNICDMDTCIQR